MATEPFVQSRTSAAPSAVFFADFKRILGRRMPGLEGLRGLAVLAVVVTHVGTSGRRVESDFAIKLFDIIADAGWVGVQLFFVLSGFLITGILLDGRGKPNQLYNFFIRRMLRILPLYYSLLAVVFIGLPALHRVPVWLQNEQHHPFWYWAFLINWINPYLDPGDQGFGHLWSLAVEEQFYLLWPLLVVRFSSRTLLRVCVAMIISATLLRIFLIEFNPGLNHQFAYMPTVCRWDALAIGAALALIVRNAKLLARLQHNAIGLTGVFITMAIAVVGVSHQFKAVASGVGLLNQLIAALLFGLLVYFTITPRALPSLIQRFALHPTLQITGKYSYAIYVFQTPIMYLWFHSWVILPEPYKGIELLLVLLYNITGVFLGSFLCAIVSWRLIELPFLRLKLLFETKPIALPAASI